jgi:methionine aminopeptidase
LVAFLLLADSARLWVSLVLAGTPSAAAAELVAVTQQALDAAMQLCGPDVPFRAIGHAIHSIADAAGALFQILLPVW